MINFEMKWLEVPCTGEPCLVCQDPIFGKQYQLHTMINGKAMPQDQVVCASCYMEIKKED